MTDTSILNVILAHNSINAQLVLKIFMIICSNEMHDKVLLEKNKNVNENIKASKMLFNIYDQLDTKKGI